MGLEQLHSFSFPRCNGTACIVGRITRVDLLVVIFKEAISIILWSKAVRGPTFFASELASEVVVCVVDVMFEKIRR